MAMSLYIKHDMPTETSYLATSSYIHPLKQRGSTKNQTLGTSMSANS